LVVTATDVDKSGASYYGEQGLYYLSTKGDGNIIPLSKINCEICCKLLGICYSYYYPNNLLQDWHLVLFGNNNIICYWQLIKLVNDMKVICTVLVLWIKLRVHNIISNFNMPNLKWAWVNIWLLMEVFFTVLFIGTMCIICKLQCDEKCMWLFEMVSKSSSANEQISSCKRQLRSGKATIVDSQCWGNLVICNLSYCKYY